MYPSMYDDKFIFETRCAAAMIFYTNFNIIGNECMYLTVTHRPHDPYNIILSQYYLLISKTKPKPSLSCLFKMKIHSSYIPYFCITVHIFMEYIKIFPQKHPFSTYKVFALFRISYFYYSYLHQLFAVISFMHFYMHMEKYNKDTRIKL